MSESAIARLLAPRAELLIAEAAKVMVPAELRCPRCKRGVKVESSYELQGMRIDDPYCGWCGRNWPER